MAVGCVRHCPFHDAFQSFLKESSTLISKHAQNGRLFHGLDALSSEVQG